MAFVEGSKLYAVKIVNDKKVLYEVSKDDVRKAPHVDSLPEPSSSKRGLIYLYDDGDGENGYICVKSGEDEYEWLSLGGNPDEIMSKDVYDKDGSVARSGGIKEYVSKNSAQSDWNEQDSSEAAYVKNRPLYDSSTTSNGISSFVTASSTTYTLISIPNTGKTLYGYQFTQMGNNYFGNNVGFRVTLDGDVYDYPSYTTYPSILIGSVSMQCKGLDYNVTDNIFMFQDTNNKIWACFQSPDNKSHVITLHWIDSGTLQKIPQKYLNLDSRERVINRTNTLSELSTDYQYPSAKAVYDFVTQNSSSVSLGTITLSTTWLGSDPYYQEVTVTGATVTSNSKVDIQPDSASMVQLGLDGITALWVENNNGTLLAYVMGGTTTLSLTIQCTVTEVD